MNALVLTGEAVDTTRPQLSIGSQIDDAFAVWGPRSDGRYKVWTRIRNSSSQSLVRPHSSDTPMATIPGGRRGDET